MAPQIKNRAIPGDQTRDPAIIELLTYNEKSGARKSVNVGNALIPLGDGAGGFTVDATTRRSLGTGGKNLAIYNNSAAVHSVTVGDVTVTAQAAGGIQNSSGNIFVGVPVPPNSWFYLSAAQWNYVIADSAALLVYLIDDPTYINTQPANNAAV